ncbi:MAG: START domain-containing protein, partial [Bacteroidota bacterium]
LLWDTEKYPQWVPHCISAYELEEQNDRSVYYYASSAFPWPLQDRDLIAYSTFSQSDQDQTITIRTTATPAYPYPDKGMIRVRQLEAIWILKPLKTGKTKVTYTLFTDPGGNVPAWGVNKFMDKGPIQTIEAMRELAKQEPYINAKWEAIVDPNN